MTDLGRLGIIKPRRIDFRRISIGAWCDHRKTGSREVGIVSLGEYSKGLGIITLEMI